VSSTVLRRFAGPEADELAILCRPEARSPDIAHQAEAAYRALAKQLAAHQSSFRDVTSETLLLRDIRRDLPLVLDIRTRVLAELGQGASAPLPAFIQQAPIDQGASFALSAWATIPRHRGAWSVRDVRAVPSCTCEGCARSGARLVRLGEQVSLHTTNVYGVGGDAFEQALDMFFAAERLLQVTEEALARGVEQARPGRRLHDISWAIQKCAEDAGYGVVRDYVGHGIGRAMHEDPQVPNYGRPGSGPRLQAGMVLAIEPMVNAGGAAVEVLDDGWTVVTVDRRLSAHFEHTVAIREEGPDVLTLPARA